jgi:hypothetical protein
LRRAEGIEQCPSMGAGKHMLVLSSSEFYPQPTSSLIASWV